MSERAGACLTLALLAAAPLAAQRPVPSDSALAALAAEWRALGTLRARAEQVRFSRAAEDTLVIGSLRILALPGAVPEAQAAGERVVTDLSRRYGRDLAGLRQNYLRITKEGASGPFGITLLGADGRGTSIGGLVGRAALYQALRSFAEQGLWLGVDPALRAWLPSSGPTTYDSAAGVRRAYYELALSTSVVSRSCVRGDLGSCEEALGIVTPADWITRWYDAAGRREILRRYRWNWSPVLDRILACGQDGDDAACIAVLRRMSTTAGRTPAERHAWEGDVLPPLPPLGEASRMRYLDLLLVSGGPEAWERLTAHAERPLTERFAAAAAIPGDSLLLAWRAQVESGRPAPSAFSGLLLVTAIVWASVFLFLSCWGRRWS